MGISVNTSKQQITASVTDESVTATVSAGIGASGPAGTAATITVGTVTTGAPGSSAVVTNAGSSSAAVLNFTIPAGATGATGAQGPQGPAGAAGASSWDDITGKPSTFTPSSHTHTFAESSTTGTYVNFLTTPGGGDLATALSGIDSALTGKAAAADFDQGLKTTDSPEFAGLAFNAYAVDWAVAPRPSLGASLDFKATVSGVTSTVFSVDSSGVITFADNTTQSTAAVPYTLPMASALTLGGVTIGSGIDVVLGQISVSTTSIGAAAASHAHSAADVTSGTFDIARIPTGTTSTTVCIGNDARLSDARTPTAHNHAASDINSGVLATARLASSGTASATTFLRGDQTWATAGSSSASDLTSGTLAYARMADPTVTSPSQISSDQNDYASFARGINRFSTDAARSMTGVVAGNSGEIRILSNIGSYALTLNHESSSSTAANRFATPTAANYSVPPGSSVAMFYDSTSSRWRVL